jgi:hypothetical protein
MRCTHAICDGSPNDSRDICPLVCPSLCTSMRKGHILLVLVYKHLGTLTTQLGIVYTQGVYLVGGWLACALHARFFASSLATLLECVQIGHEVDHNIAGLLVHPVNASLCVLTCTCKPVVSTLGKRLR